MGAADTINVVVRVALVQLSTPDAMRGRVGAVNFLFIGASNQLGEFESGMAAALLGAMPAAALGGLGTIAIALLWMKLFFRCCARSINSNEPEGRPLPGPTAPVPASTCPGSALYDNAPSTPRVALSISST